MSDPETEERWWDEAVEGWHEPAGLTVLIALGTVVLAGVVRAFINSPADAIFAFVAVMLGVFLTTLSLTVDWALEEYRGGGA